MSSRKSTTTLDAELVHELTSQYVRSVDASKAKRINSLKADYYARLASRGFFGKLFTAPYGDDVRRVKIRGEFYHDDVRELLKASELVLKCGGGEMQVSISVLSTMHEYLGDSFISKTKGDTNV